MEPEEFLNCVKADEQRLPDAVVAELDTIISRPSGTIPIRPDAKDWLLSGQTMSGRNFWVTLKIYIGRSFVKIPASATIKDGKAYFLILGCASSVDGRAEPLPIN